MNNFTIGSYATDCLASVDYGALGIIRGYTVGGDLILENPRLGKWVADPAKCKPYDPPIEG